MKDTEYAFCVARIRAKETQLLSNEFLSRLVEAPSYDEALRLLAEKGWMDADASYSEAIKAHGVELWELLKESVPDKKALDALCVLNDYFNIKTAVKCSITGENASDFYLYPTTVCVDGLSEDIRLRNFSRLSQEHCECAKQAYDLAVKTENGQNVDILIDKEALNALLRYSESIRSSVFTEVCNFIVDTSNIKTALRCSFARKSTDFISEAISKCKYIDKDRLISFANKDADELYSYLESGKYAEGVALYKDSPASFDKWCDDGVVNIIRSSKYSSFGFGPVCAYYYAKMTELKSVRIILASKKLELDKDTLRERVRNLYA